MNPADFASIVGSLAGPIAMLVIAIRFYFVFDRKASDRINEAEKDAAKARAETRAADQRADDERQRRIAAEAAAARLEARSGALEVQIAESREEIARLRTEIAQLRDEIVRLGGRMA